MKQFMYVSGWDMHGGAPGIGLHEFDTETGEINFIRMIRDDLAFNATAYDSKKNILYVDNETSVLPGEFTGGGGRVFAFSVNKETGDLTELCAAPTFIPNPAWPQLTPDGKHLLVANHSAFGTATKLVQKEDGSYGYELIFDDAGVEVFDLNEDGTIGKITDVKKHDVITHARSLHSHPHSIVPAPLAKDLYFVTDKGECTIHVYRFDANGGKLTQVGQPYALAEGSAPRYIFFHPTKPWFYVNQERNMDLCCFSYTPEGEISEIGKVSTLPEGLTQPKGVLFEQQGFTISTDGKYLYDILNGPNLIAVFAVDQENGMAKPIQHMQVEGRWPRALTLSKDGKFLLAGCLQSGDIYSYRVAEDGRLSKTGFHSLQQGASTITLI